MAAILEKIVSVLYYVEDINRATADLEKLLGATPILKKSSLAIFQIENLAIVLHPTDDKSAQYGNNTVVYWRVKNLVDAIDYLTLNGGKLYRGPLVLRETSEKVCQVVGGDNIVIGLSEKLVV